MFQHLIKENLTYRIVMGIEPDLFGYVTLFGVRVILRSHVILLLDNLGFDSIRAIAKIDFEMIRKIELTIQTLYTGSDVFATMCDTKKKTRFGPFFWKNPCLFRLLPGDVASLSCTAELCNQIIEENGHVPLLQVILLLEFFKIFT